MKTTKIGFFLGLPYLDGTAARRGRRDHFSVFWVMSASLLILCSSWESRGQAPNRSADPPTRQGAGAGGDLQPRRMFPRPASRLERMRTAPPTPEGRQVVSRPIGASLSSPESGQDPEALPGAGRSELAGVGGGGEAAAPERFDLPFQKDHILEPNDLIRVKVYQEQDLETDVRVGNDGNIHLPLLKTVSVAGRSIAQVNRLITDLLGRDFLVNPQVNVTLIEYSKRRFTILGAVQAPGIYEMPGNSQVTLVEAIGLAGGFKSGARQRKVVVTRVIDGVKMVRHVDAEALAKSKDSKVFPILPDDHIFVDETFF